MHEKYFLRRQKRGEFIGMFKKLRHNEFSAAFLRGVTSVLDSRTPGGQTGRRDRAEASTMTQPRDPF